MMDAMGGYGDFDLARAVGLHLNRAAFLMSEEIARRFRAAGYPLSAQDFGILYRLDRHGPQTQMMIAAQMLRDKTTITRRIDGLVKKGLIERVNDSRDRRCFRASLTPEGGHCLKLLEPIVSAFQEEVLIGVTDQERQITIDVLEKISARLMNR